MASAATQNPSRLTGVAVLERDQNNDTVWAWVYPDVSEEMRAVVLGKTGVNKNDLEKPRRIFGRYGNDTWFYIVTCPADIVPGADLPSVETLSIVIFAEQFFPEMYYALAGTMLQQYAAGGNGPALLTTYLSVFTSGSFENFALSDFKDVRKAYLKGSIKAVIQKFGIESILIYIAVLLKQRIAIVCPDPAELVTLVRVAPQFVFKRLDWGIIYPYVDSTDGEIDKLVATKTPYIAGFTDESIAEREDLYDVLIDVPNTEIVIASHSTKTFGLSKIHKEIAMYMTSAAEDPDVKDMDIIKELVERTDTLLEGLNKLAKPSENDGDKMVVSIDAIRARKMPPSMHKFLYNLALAEDMAESGSSA